MLLDHIGYHEASQKLTKAIEVCSEYEKKLVLTGRPDGATGDAYAQYVMDTLSRDDLDEIYAAYAKK
jgi:isocitrate dehydrogenase (NAD+)